MSWFSSTSLCSSLNFFFCSLTSLVYLSIFQDISNWPLYYALKQNYSALVVGSLLWPTILYIFESEYFSRFVEESWFLFHFVLSVLFHWSIELSVLISECECVLFLVNILHISINLFCWYAVVCDFLGTVLTYSKLLIIILYTLYSTTRPAAREYKCYYLYYIAV